MRPFRQSPRLPRVSRWTCSSISLSGCTPWSTGHWPGWTPWSARWRILICWAEVSGVDHLVTQFRRQVESLAVMGGAVPRRINKPVPLPTVLRQGVAEIEQYARVRVIQPRWHSPRVCGSRDHPSACRTRRERCPVLRPRNTGDPAGRTSPGRPGHRDRRPRPADAARQAPPDEPAAHQAGSVQHPRATGGRSHRVVRRCPDRPSAQHRGRVAEEHLRRQPGRRRSACRTAQRRAGKRRRPVADPRDPSSNSGVAISHPSPAPHGDSRSSSAGASAEGSERSGPSGEQGDELSVRRIDSPPPVAAGVAFEKRLPRRRKNDTQNSALHTADITPAGGGRPALPKGSETHLGLELPESDWRATGRSWPRTRT